MKRLLCIGMAAVLAFALAACGGTQGDGPPIPDVQQTPRSEQVVGWTPDKSMAISGAGLAPKDAYVYENGIRALARDGDYFYYDFPYDADYYDDVSMDKIHTSRGIFLGDDGEAVAEAYSGIACFVLHLEEEFDDPDDYENYTYNTLADFQAEYPDATEYYVMFNWVTLNGEAVSSVEQLDEAGEYGLYSLYFYIYDGVVDDIEFGADA